MGYLGTISGPSLARKSVKNSSRNRSLRIARDVPGHVVRVQHLEGMRERMELISKGSAGAPLLCYGSGAWMKCPGSTEMAVPASKRCFLTAKQMRRPPVHRSPRGSRRRSQPEKEKHSVSGRMRGGSLHSREYCILIEQRMA